MNKKELAEQILEKHMKQHMDTGQFGDINHPITFAEWVNHSFFGKSAIAAIIEAMGAASDTTKAENELEEQLVENILSEFERIGIDTSEWEEKYGDGNFAHEFIAAGIRGHLEEIEAMGEKPESNQTVIISDEQLNEAWGNANFGNVSKREVVIDTLKKVAQGWGTGHTAMCIVKELGLVEGRNGHDGLSDKGLMYLFNESQQSVEAMGVQPGMRWVKASERLPEPQRNMVIKIEGEPFIGDFQPNGKFLLSNFGTKQLYRGEDSYQYIEWLEEAIEPKVEAMGVQHCADIMGATEP